MQRRLAAVLAADVVEYSRLVGEDQDRMLTALKALRTQLLAPMVERHQGHVVKSMGDGWLVEFPSVGNAVDCAIDIQTGIEPYEPIILRIGVHIGDIAFDDDDIFGDGVNIAARLEELARPGEVLISDTAYHSLDRKASDQFSGGENRELKNITRTVAVWRWPGETDGIPASEAVPKVSDRPAVAVLPFNNMSGDPEQEYFSDGISEDIITDLSKTSGLLVIARNSSFAYKGQSPDIRRVCRDLGVGFVLEGSVRRAGNRIRINAQLIDGSDGSHIWSERYDRELEDIFAVQDEVTREIVGALKVELTDQERERQHSRHQPDLEAYDIYSRGRAGLTRFTAEDNKKCQTLFKKSIGIDPDFAPSYGALSVAICTAYLNGWDGANRDDLDTALQLAQRACRMDPDNAECFVALSLCQTWLRNLSAAIEAGERAISLDPNTAFGLTAFGQALDFSGQHERAVEMFQGAFRRDPRHDLTLHLTGRAQMAMGQYDEAAKNFRRRLIHNPKTDLTRAYLAATLGHLGQTEEARQVWHDLNEINPGFDPDRARAILPYTTENWFDRYFGGLKKAGLIE